MKTNYEAPLAELINLEASSKLLEGSQTIPAGIVDDEFDWRS